MKAKQFFTYITRMSFHDWLCKLALGTSEAAAVTNYLLIGMAPLLMLSNMLTAVSQAEASAKAGA